MRHFHYKAGDGLIRITTSRRPSFFTIPKRGTWVAKEWNATACKWEMPICPEVTWKILEKMDFLGSIPFGIGFACKEKK